MSQRGPTGRATPRWSVASHAPSPLPGDAGLPASIAGLPGSSAWLSVGPSLSPRGPSFGSAPVMSPVAFPVIVQFRASWIRLQPADVRVPTQTARGVTSETFPAMIELATLRLASIPAPNGGPKLGTPWATLSAMVQLSRNGNGVALPITKNSRPAPRPAWLPLIVTFA